RVGTNWLIGSQPAASADARVLNDARPSGWLQLDHEPIDPYESVRVTLTDAGRGVLAHYWADWSPTDDLARGRSNRVGRADRRPRPGRGGLSAGSRQQRYPGTSLGTGAAD